MTWLWWSAVLDLSARMARAAASRAMTWLQHSSSELGLQLAGDVRKQ